MEITPEGKKWYTSKTLVFNVIMGIVQVAGVLATQEGGLSMEYQKIWATIVVAGNALLRFITSEPLRK